jgi:hypothetical protein
MALRDSNIKTYGFWIVATGLIVALGAGLLIYKTSSTSPVPKSIAKQVSFPVYYPDPKHLPTGYKLDATSFTIPDKDVVLYAVKYSRGQLAFSVQAKPSEAELKQFTSQRIPLHTNLKTDVGEAAIGAIGNQSVVSLPTENAWIIVTGPYATDQSKLANVLKALRY